MPPPPGPADATARLRAHALRLGFDLCGVARAEPLHAELADLRAFLAEGRHGDLEWLAREPERRCDPTVALPGCRAVVVLAMNYQVPEDRERVDPEPAARIARYARGRDYHRVFEKRLRKIARAIDAADGASRSKPYVDHGPVMERAWAVRAGLGFVGKHTLLIHPERGSWFLLGCVLTTADLEPTVGEPSRSGCGDCRRCIDACPTGAITDSWRFDARRCISYLTIEQASPPPQELADATRPWLFGCDVCQEVCPYNQKRSVPREDGPFGTHRLPAAWGLSELTAMAETELAERIAGTPLIRVGAVKLKRRAGEIASGEVRPGPLGDSNR
jgi:epoxyqueuosine reductase